MLTLAAEPRPPALIYKGRRLRGSALFSWLLDGGAPSLGPQLQGLLSLTSNLPIAPEMTKSL